jgi:hypothetical protein
LSIDLAATMLFHFENIGFVVVSMNQGLLHGHLRPARLHLLCFRCSLVK